MLFSSDHTLQKEGGNVPLLLGLGSVACPATVDGLCLWSLEQFKQP